MALPSVDDVEEYLGDTSFTSGELGKALAVELAAQSRVCRVPAADAVWPADLAEAVFRRVARNLALRNVPLAVLQGSAEGGSTVLPGRDPEVRRLEAPYRKLTLG